MKKLALLATFAFAFAMVGQINAQEPQNEQKEQCEKKHDTKCDTGEHKGEKKECKKENGECKKDKADEKK